MLLCYFYLFLLKKIDTFYFPLPSQYPLSASPANLSQRMDKISDVLKDGTETDWEERMSALKDLRGLMNGVATFE